MKPRSQYLRVMQIGETAVTQRAHEIQRERGAFVAAQQQRRIRLARFGGELGAIHEIAAERRQRDAVARLGVRRSGLGVLAGHAADANDRLLQSVQQHEAHLQQDLELLGDLVRLALLERLGAVAAHEQELAAALRFGQTLAQLFDFPRHHERRQSSIARPRCSRVSRDPCNAAVEPRGGRSSLLDARRQCRWYAWWELF